MPEINICPYSVVVVVVIVVVVVNFTFSSASLEPLIKNSISNKICKRHTEIKGIQACY